MKKQMMMIVVAATCATTVFAQLTVLDRYTIPLNKKGATVGKLVVPDGRKSVLVKDEAGIFVLNEGVLSLKKNVSVAPGTPFSYVVTIQCGNEIKSFELVKDEFVHNKVIAHRGAWKHHGVHQNSTGSLRHAIDLGCEGSEFDVWLTKDGKVALNHDNDLDGMIVEKSDLARLRTIPLENGEVIPTLEDYIALIKTQNKTRLVLEFKSNKNGRAIALTDSAVNIVHRLKAQAWVDYISFDYAAVKRVRELDPTAHIAYLTDDVPMDLLKADGISGIDYHYSLFEKLPKLYERARMLGLTINVWTVNDEQRMKTFLEMNVDFITTDEPALMLQLIGK
ncbi:MAG: glycerophosphodiester phosphodiesterase [Bacteroidales bacterium]|jgi:glycerophosphoryl diester phosphodiesterase|nr:glycerophosphodiester phosphodiesterase [Bacteroidales bacterium]